jgi:peroxiredoxin
MSRASPHRRPAPEALREAVLVARDGRRFPFHELLGARPLLAVFLRQFGCIGCAEQVHGLLPRLPEIAALGVRAVLIGSGAPDHIGAFLERHGLADKAIELFTDPALDAYRAAELRRSAWATHGPGALVDFVRALTHGHRPGRVDGDAYQQGGALLVDDDGTIAWAHTSDRLGGHADPADVVDAVLALRLRRAPLPV